MIDPMVKALVAIHAYDDGCVDSGLHDEVLREQTKIWLRDPTSLKVLSIGIREMYLSDGALEEGYTLEDVADFVRWLDYRMGYSL